MPAPETPPAVQNGGGAPRATLLCRPNSHPFNDRNLLLDQEIKIGRSVARAKPTLTNAIFDCKVLSRNHAVLWYSLGKFYLQDTKSSNGTFVNNQRLSKGAEESAPREVCSGDILQFGVDVMENSRKVTHGCIIATLKLFLPDGKEAKASPSIVNSTNSCSIPPQDLYQLNTFIQESLAREQLLENKLLVLQGIVAETELASKNGWRALMEEDRLLTRVEILENQLSTYGKNMSEEKLREEAKRLMEDKEKYQMAAKENLKHLVDDKLEAENKLKETETALGNMEDEYTSLRTLYNNILDENTKLSEKISTLSEELSKRLREAELLQQETEAELLQQENENKKDLLIEDALSDLIQNGHGVGLLKDGEDDLDTTDRMISDITDRLISDVIADHRLAGSTDKMISSTDSLDGSKPEVEQTQLTDAELKLNEANRMRGLVELVEDLVRTRERQESDINNLKGELQESRSDNSAVLQELNTTKTLLEAAEKRLTSQNSDQQSKDQEHLLEPQDTLKQELEPQDTLKQELEPQDTLKQESLEVLKETRGPDCSLNNLDPELTLKRPVKRQLSNSPNGQEFLHLNRQISQLEEENLLLKERLRESETTSLLSMGSPLAQSDEPLSSPLPHPQQHLVATSRQQMLGNDPVETLFFAPTRVEAAQLPEGKSANAYAAKYFEKDNYEENSEDLPSPDEIFDLDVNERYPDANERYQDINERYPDINERYPDANERYPDANERYPDANEQDADVDEQNTLAERLERVDPLDMSDGALNLSYSSSDLSTVERALSTAEEKIAKLLKVKEKLVAIQTEKLVLEESIGELEETIEAFSLTSRVLTFVNIVPVVVLLIAIVLAFLPSISNVVGTRDTI